MLYVKEYPSNASVFRNIYVRKFDFLHITKILIFSLGLLPFVLLVTFICYYEILDESDIHVLWLPTENSSGSGTKNDSKPSFGSPMIRISVIKKPVASSDSNKPVENKQVEESKGNDTSTGLQSLFQNYDSDDEDD